MGARPGTLCSAACLCRKTLPEHQVLGAGAEAVAACGFPFGLAWWKPKAQLGSCLLCGVGGVAVWLCCRNQSWSPGIGRCFIRRCVAEAAESPDSSEYLDVGKEA